MALDPKTNLNQDLTMNASTEMQNALKIYIDTPREDFFYDAGDWDFIDGTISEYESSSDWDFIDGTISEYESSSDWDFIDGTISEFVSSSDWDHIDR